MDGRILQLWGPGRGRHSGRMMGETEEDREFTRQFAPRVSASASALELYTRRMNCNNTEEYMDHSLRNEANVEKNNRRRIPFPVRRPGHSFTLQGKSTACPMVKHKKYLTDGKTEALYRAMSRNQAST